MFICGVGRVVRIACASVTDRKIVRQNSYRVSPYLLSWQTSYDVVGVPTDAGNIAFVWRGRYTLVMKTVDIKTLRRKMGMSQRELADYLCVSQVAVSHWERGERIPSRPIRKLLQQLRSDRKK